MLARAERDFKAGERLVMGGHHHSIVDMTPLLVPGAEAAGKAPFYLAANKQAQEKFDPHGDAALVLAFGELITTRVPESTLKLVVGTLILLFGLRWLHGGEHQSASIPVV